MAIRPFSFTKLLGIRRWRLVLFGISIQYKYPAISHLCTEHGIGIAWPQYVREGAQLKYRMYVKHQPKSSPFA